jgi:hypothetical protein
MEDQERPRKQALYFRPLHSFTNPPTHRGGVARPLDPTAMACSQFHSVNEARITVGVPNPKENAIDQRIVVAVSQGRGDIGNMSVAMLLPSLRRLLSGHYPVTTQRGSPPGTWVFFDASLRIARSAEPAVERYLRVRAKGFHHLLLAGHTVRIIRTAPAYDIAPPNRYSALPTSVQSIAQRPNNQGIRRSENALILRPRFWGVVPFPRR